MDTVQSGTEFERSLWADVFTQLLRHDKPIEDCTKGANEALIAFRATFPTGELYEIGKVGFAMGEDPPPSF